MVVERAAATALTATLALSLVGACDRGHREAPATPLPAPTTPAPAPAKPGCTLTPLPIAVPITPKRLVAIGDIHGDLGGARAALRAAKAIDDKDRWIGGDLVIVQTGDILDRGDDEQEIMALFDKLAAEAPKTGGAVIVLNGNHELMNTARDYRYVTPGAASDFGGDRQKAFDPGGPVAKQLAKQNIVAVVGGVVFSHAGVLPEWLTQLDDVNMTARCWLDGQAGGPMDPPLALASDSSPVWTRAYGMPEVDCSHVDTVLAKLNSKRMVVAHTVQQNGISAACDGKLWRIDVGLAKLYGGPIEVLELSDPPRVLKGSR